MSVRHIIFATSNRRFMIYHAENPHIYRNHTSHFQTVYPALSLGMNIYRQVSHCFLVLDMVIGKIL